MNWDKKVKLALDYLHDRELTYESLALTHGLHTSRSHQIIKEVLRKYGLITEMPSIHSRGYIKNHRLELGQKLGLALQRRSRRFGDDNPEGFYWGERAHDEADEHERRFGYPVQSRRW